MTDLPKRAAETALEDLTDRSILISNLESLTFFLPPLTAKFIRTRRPEAVTQTGDALTDRAYALAMQYGGEQRLRKIPHAGRRMGLHLRRPAAPADRRQ